MVLLTFSHFSLTAQVKWTLLVEGLVLNEDKKLEGATVFLYRDSAEFQKVVTTENGKFSFLLEPENEYLLKFTKLGHVHKSIYINTKGVPDGQIKPGLQYKSSPEISLFEIIEGLNVDILDQPIGKLYYNPLTKNFDYDSAYTKSIQGKVAQLKRDLEQKKAENAVKEKAAPIKKVK